ncbi:unnamed protein product [Kuraishia capsulata CBS 1993]|uniref:Uncharacterized protein n=1 Tax=Kuraishia capsulata CBS 1993 TaxID=1382522 RepID=W6MXT2_9ASCO|nr:uncharacterized protein KUCA_T00005418001 [Kuraishia capsulata CBS 1993]CDK29430.1 unnamed protein product [Kuraishia capsulata CBS 1993]
MDDRVFGKRRHPPEASSHPFKKRLVDSLSSLSIGSDPGRRQSISRPTSPFSSSEDNLLPAYEPHAYANSQTSDRIVIPSIEKFLRENPDYDDSATRPINVFEEIDPMKLVIPNLRAVNELFNSESSFNNEAYLAERKRFSYERVAAQKKRELEKKMRSQPAQFLGINNDMNDEGAPSGFEVEVTDNEIYRDAYALRYWSLVKWYDPTAVVLENLREWRNSESSVYVPDDGDTSFYMDESMDVAECSTPSRPNPNWESEYGSYYASTPVGRQQIEIDDMDMDID